MTHQHFHNARTGAGRTDAAHPDMEERGMSGLKRLLLGAMAAMIVAAGLLAASPGEEAHAMYCWKTKEGPYVCTAP